jgi:hypothetical protein
MNAFRGVHRTAGGAIIGPYPELPATEASRSPS